MPRYFYLQMSCSTTTPRCFFPQARLTFSHQITKMQTTMAIKVADLKGFLQYCPAPSSNLTLRFLSPVISIARFLKVLMTVPSFLRSRGLLRLSATFCFNRERTFKLGSEAVMRGNMRESEQISWGGGEGTKHGHVVGCKRAVEVRWEDNRANRPSNYAGQSCSP